MIIPVTGFIFWELDYTLILGEPEIYYVDFSRDCIIEQARLSA